MTLLSESISLNDLINAEIMLKKFVFLVEELYGKKHMTYNVHQLLHAVDTVHNWGPLWPNSTFAFESYNGNLLKMFHGTQGVPLQNINNFTLWKYIPKLMTSFVYNKSPQVETYCKSLLSGLLSTKYAFHVNDDVTVLGCAKFCQTTIEERLALERLLNDPVPDNVAFHDRAIVHNKLLHTKAYTRVRKRNSSAVVFNDGSFGIITRICIIEGTCFIIYNPVVLYDHRSIITDRQTGSSAPHI